MPRASKAPSPRAARFTNVGMNHAFNAFALPAIHPGLGSTKTSGLPTKKTSPPFPRLQPTHPNIGLAPTLHPMLRDFLTLFRPLTATNRLPTLSKISRQKVLITNHLMSLSPKKTLTFSLNSAGFLRSLPSLSLTGPPLGYRRDLPPYMHPPFGTLYGPLTPTMFHYKNFMPSSSSTYLPSSSTTLGKNLME